MAPSSSQTNKLKSTLRLLIPRLRMLQKKDAALSVASRREMAQLLASGKEASARIRVENIIANDVTVEVMEILELYCELLLARGGMLDLVEPKERLKAKEASATETKDEAVDIAPGTGSDGWEGLDEAAASLLYASARLPRDVKELGTLRTILIDRWGKDFAIKAQENRGGDFVPERVVKRLRVDPPSKALVEEYLKTIASAYRVDWPKREVLDDVGRLQEEVDAENQQENTGDGDVNDGAGAVTTITTTIPTTPMEDDLTRATPPRNNVSDSSSRTTGSVSVAPPGPRTDNPSPKVKIPGASEDLKSASVTTKTTAAAPTAAPSSPSPAAANRKSSGNDNRAAVAPPPPSKVPDLDELAKRFMALGKR